MKITLSCLGLLLALFVFISCGIAIALLVCFACGNMGADAATPATTPAVQPVTPAQPVVPVTPQPDDKKSCPGPDCPDQRKRRWAADTHQPVRLVSISQARGKRTFDGPIHNGQEVQIDLPAYILKRNITSKGLGCCVPRSIDYAAHWQNVPELIDLPEKMVKAGIAGGGWPEKVDQLMAKFAPNVPYIQVQNGDWNIVKLALKTGRLPCITVMGGAHMVNLVKMDSSAAFRDNNFIGENEVWWMTEQEAKQETICNYTGGKFWAVILLPPPPPAPPCSARVERIRYQLEAPLLSGRYEWRTWADERDQFALWHEGKQAGVYTSAGDYYRELIAAGQWGQSYRRPPIPLPDAALERLEDIPSGVRVEAISTRACYTYCGCEITREQAAATLEDDSAKLSLTAIGNPAETAKVKADLDSPEFAAFKSRVCFQQYTRDNWAVSPQRYGFDVSGHPTIYLQDRDGNVLWHANSYEGAATLTTLRKKDPGYTPANDPGIRQPDVLSGDGISEMLPIGAVCFGIWILMSLAGGALGLAAHLGKEIFTE